MMKKNDCIQKPKIFYIPNIKLVGYGRSQTYQCICCKCGDLYFNLNKEKTLDDLFCSWCDSNEKFISETNSSNINFIGNICGWVVKCSHTDSKKRSFYNYKKVFKRDRYTCQYCGYSLQNATEFRTLEIDHIRPWSCSGSNRMENLAVCCGKCNRHASNKWFNTFEEKKQYLINIIQKEIS
jgi:hypothetical protein